MVDVSTPDFAVLLHRGLRERCVHALRAQIVAGKLKPGELHSIGSVAEQLGVSVTPVREALLDLVREELVEIVRNRGFRVITLTDTDLDDLFEMRLLLEVPVVEKVARTKPDMSTLRSLAAQTKSCAINGDMVGFVASDRDLHLGILELGGNPRLTKLVGLLRDQTRLYGLENISGSQSFLDSAEEHDQLLDLIGAGEASAAAALMRRHLRHTRGLWAGRPDSEMT